MALDGDVGELTHHLPDFEMLETYISQVDSFLDELDSAVRPEDEGSSRGDGCVIKQSLIDGGGKGVFATQPFSAGQWITEYESSTPGESVTLDEVALLSVQTHVLTLQPKHSYISGLRDPQDHQGCASMINGTNDRSLSNVMFKRNPAGFPNRAFAVATRYIEKGEELYAIYEDQSFSMGVKRLSHSTDSRFGKFITEDAGPYLSMEEERLNESYRAALDAANKAKERVRASESHEVYCSTVLKSLKDVKVEKEMTRLAQEALQSAREMKRTHALHLKSCQRVLDKCNEADIRQFNDDFTTLHTEGVVHIEKKDHEIREPPFATRPKYVGIFNNDLDDKFSHRLQARFIRGKEVDPEILDFEEDVHRELHDRRGWLRTSTGVGRNVFKEVCNGYKLKSVASCADALPRKKTSKQCTCNNGCRMQLFHADSCQGEQLLKKNCPWSDVPLVLIMARSDCTPFHYFPFGSDEACTIVLMRGDILIFRGDTFPLSPSADPTLILPPLYPLYPSISHGRRSHSRGGRVQRGQRPGPRLHRLASPPSPTRRDVCERAHCPNVLQMRRPPSHPRVPSFPEASRRSPRRAAVTLVQSIRPGHAASRCVCRACEAAG